MTSVKRGCAPAEATVAGGSYHYWIAVLAPLLLLVTWHLRNQAYPVSEIAAYLISTQEIFEAFRIDGLGAALEQAYFTRGFRPILHVLLGAPFLVLFDGNVINAIAAASSIFYFLYLHFNYRLACLFMSKRASAVWTIFIGLSAAVFSSAVLFYSESPYLAFLTAAFYYALKSDYLSRARESRNLGVWLGLSIAARPVEVILFCAAPLSYFIYRSYRRGRLTRVDLSLLALQLALTAAFFAIFIVLKRNPTSYEQILSLAALTAPPIIACLMAPRKLSPPFVSATLSCYFIALYFFAPTIYTLFYWTYESSIMPLGDLMYGRDRIGPFEYLSIVFPNITGWPMVALLVAAAYCALRKRVHFAVKARQLGLPLVLTSMVALPLLSGAFSSAWVADTRYLHSSTTLLFFVAFVTASKSFPAILLLGIVNTLNVSAAIIADGAGFQRLSSALSRYAGHVAQPLTEADPHKHLLAEILKHLPNDQPANVCVQPLLGVPAFVDRPDAFPLMMISLESRLPLKFQFLSNHEIFADRSFATHHDFVVRNCDYTLIGPLSGQRLNWLPLTWIADDYRQRLDRSPKDFRRVTIESASGGKAMFYLVDKASLRRIRAD